MAQPHVEQFVRQMWPHAVEIGDRYGIDPVTIIAQAAQETGWGRHVAGNNYFGIKSHGQAGGQTVTTHEYVNGERVQMQDSFRAYNGMAESIEGYAQFLHANPRYAEALRQTGYRDQLQAIADAGYATDPNYARSILSVARLVESVAPPTPPQTVPPRQAPVPAPLSQRPASEPREAPMPATMSPGLAAQRSGAAQLSDIGLTGEPARTAPTPATMSPALAAQRAAAGQPATGRIEVFTERAEPMPLPPLPPPGSSSRTAPQPATMSPALAAQRAGNASPAPAGPAVQRVAIAPTPAIAGTVQMAPGARPSIVDQMQVRNEQVMPGPDPRSNDIGSGVSWVDFNNFVQTGSQVPKYLTETVRVPAAQAAPQPATMSAGLAAQRAGTPASSAAPEQQFTTMTVQRLNPEWVAAQPAAASPAPIPATMSPGLAAQRAGTPALSDLGLMAGLGAASAAPVPATMSPGLAAQRAATPASRPDDGSGNSGGNGTIAGSATGQSYNVGQVYESGGYLYEARADGTFAKVGNA